jgi:hypothetical protein
MREFWTLELGVLPKYNVQLSSTELCIPALTTISSSQVSFPALAMVYHLVQTKIMESKRPEVWLSGRTGA